MKRVSRAVAFAGLFVVLALVLGGTFATPVAAHYAGLRLSGWGTATIDGRPTPGEWDQAGSIGFQINRPADEGGGTMPATMFVMNDKTNLFLMLRIARPTLGYISYAIEFDNDHDGNWPEARDDVLVVNVSKWYPAEFNDVYRYPCWGCDPGGGSWSAYDSYAGGGILPPGTSDGAAAASNDGQFTYIEITHPLRSGDSLHDINLVAGQTVGFWSSIRVFNLVTNYPIDTDFPPYSMGDIVIQSPYTLAGFFQPVDNPPMVNLAVAGQTVPVKWSLVDRRTGQPVIDPGVVSSYTFQPGSCLSGATDAIDQYAGVDASSLKYDAQANQFVLNWKTDRSWAGQCGTFTLVLDDGSRHTLEFQFK